MTVIADDSGPIASAASWAASAPACDAETTDVLLEVALFDPLRTAATGRKLGIESDARYRFERGLDPELCPAREPRRHAADPRALRRRGRRRRRRRRGRRTPAAVRFRRPRLARLAGHRARVPAIERILQRSRLRACRRPRRMAGRRRRSWRHDVTTEACIVEELARLHGYRRIPPVPLTRDSGRQPGRAHGRPAPARRGCGARSRHAASRGGHLVVHPAGAGATVRRGASRSG